MLADNVAAFAAAAPCYGAAAVDRRPTGRAAIDRSYLLAAGPTAAKPPQRRAVAGGTDRQTDERPTVA